MISTGGDPPIRVLIVDDSAVARQAISRSIRAAGDMTVAGLAGNGRIGLEHIALDEPDVVVLDLEMPEMDGMAFLREVRTSHPDLPVVVFSALTDAGAAATLAALAAGASAFALKPSALRGFAEGSVDTELIPQIRALAPHHSRGTTTRGTTTRAATSHTADTRASRLPTSLATSSVNAVTVAVSTGGPTALGILLSAIPASLPVPIFVVQHMPETFTRLLAQRLAANCSLAVVEAHDGQLVRPGVVYVAPGGHHMLVAREGTSCRIKLDDGPPENSCRPAADVLFRSAAAVYRGGVLGVVMTGMGHDGLAGSRALVRAGGSVLVQDPATAVVASMPAAVLAADLAEAALGLPELAAEIVHRCGGRHR